MTTIVTFTPEHLAMMKFRPQELERIELDPRGWDKVNALIQYGTCGAVLHHGQVIGVIGFIEMWPGVLEVLAFPCADVKDFAVAYLKTCRHWIDRLIEVRRPHRLQTTAIADELHDRWMGFLGVTYEGDMKHYYVNKTDARMWARVLS